MFISSIPFQLLLNLYFLTKLS